MLLLNVKNNNLHWSVISLLSYKEKMQQLIIIKNLLRISTMKCALGGLVGITLNPDQVAEWVLSYHIGNTVSLAMDDMFDNEEDGEMGGPHVKHKEDRMRLQSGRQMRLMKKILMQWRTIHKRYDLFIYI